MPSAARKALKDVQKALEEASLQRKGAEERALEAEQRINLLEAKLEEETRDTSDMDLFRRRVKEEMEDARDQYQKELTERDFTIDQTRQKYQGT